MLVQAILVGLVGAFGCLDYQLGTLYAFRPIVKQRTYIHIRS